MLVLWDQVHLFNLNLILFWLNIILWVFQDIKQKSSCHFYSWEEGKGCECKIFYKASCKWECKLQLPLQESHMDHLSCNLLIFLTLILGKVLLIFLDFSYKLFYRLLLLFKFSLNCNKLRLSTNQPLIWCIE